MGRIKLKTRETKSRIYIIGEGITEQYYFAHIKRLLGFNYTIKPRFFGSTSISDMRKKLEELLRNDILVICVFDADVSLYNVIERKRLIQLQTKYAIHRNVLICHSLPSIEFWFLLHYIETNRHFNSTKEVETLLKKHIPDYEKTSLFLEKEKWVNRLCADSKIELAIQRAKECTEDNGSYSNVYKIFDLLRKNS